MSKTVNISNFEVYAVDYFDGKLSEKEQQALFAFLETHPLLMADFEWYKQSQDVVIQPDTVVFPRPEELKKNVIFPVHDVNEANYQDHFIAFHEDDLDEPARQTLSAFLKKNVSLLPEFESFGKIRLVPDKNVIFNDKRRLKHTPFRFSSAVRIAAVAAVAAILLLFFLFRPTADVPPSSATPEQVFVQTDDNETETLSSSDNVIPPKAGIPSNQDISKEIAGKAYNDNGLLHSVRNDGKQRPEPEEDLPSESLLAEQHPSAITTADFTETVRVLEPDVVVIKTISESESVAEDPLTVNQMLPQKNRSLWKVLSWSVKQYNTIANDDVAIVKVENLTTNETVYYLCRGE
ncbi:MAG: hypothetical protein FWG84_04740 [Bacteroidales bacterium]|nr:hypothetical protein [Bacteroidales bacterium]